MGSPKSERGREKNEDQHRVRIAKPFYLGVYEVTQAEYARVMGTKPSWFSSGGSGSGSVVGVDTQQFPVDSVSWDDAVRFCERLTALPEERSAGRVYRLPTEAEWEYACRANTTTPLHFGLQLNGQKANCNGSHPYGTTAKGPFISHPTRVGSYPANAFGLCDMHGNVHEWCADWYAADYYGKSPVDDPLGPGSGTRRVVRGGGWGNSAVFCRAAWRDSREPSAGGAGRGFRVALAPPGR
jgi:formylglycine-generating enzyme required for sulfatase activity